MKKLILILSIALTLVVAYIYTESTASDIDKIDLLIIYEKDSDGYLDIYQNFEQSLIANLNVDSISLAKLNARDIKKYNAIYLDPSILGKEVFNKNKKSIMKFVKSGGHIFLEDSFHNEFPFEFIGAEDFKEIEKFPVNLSFPDQKENLKGIQDIVKLFHKDITTYYDINTLENLNKGYGFHPTTATSLVKDGDLTLYGVNSYGDGKVFYANSLLPNHNYITGFDMLPKNETQEYFSFTFATGNYLFRNEFISYVSKELYGYSAKKVLGTYGRPAMAWQNHFEVKSAVKDKSMQTWTELLKEYNQIPSYSLARTLYEWGEWKESIIFHKNIGANNELKFAGEEENSHYASGEHFETTTDYMSINKYPEFKSLASEIELPYRAYPTVGDLNNDGMLDIVSGSSDGYLYLFQGKEDNVYEDKIKLTDEQGNPIKVGTYSTPQLIDINNNGTLDLIVGNGEGKVDLYLNIGKSIFKKSSYIIEDKNLRNATPTLGDIDGDGTPDLLVGESKGSLSFHKGNWVDNTLTFDKKGILLKEANNVANLGEFPAPTLQDIDGDGKLDLIVGDATGYIKRYSINYPNIEYLGFLEGETLNPKGDRRLWGGYYSVPAFKDIDNDGVVDLIVGQIEFGLPIPIDSELFPYKEELKQALDHSAKNHIDIYVHTYFHPYKSSAQEIKELELHKKSFEYYNLPWVNIGVNQHTWNINNLNPVQSFTSEEDAGIDWNSGFRPSMKAGEPSLARDYLWATPFRLGNGEKTKDFILFNPGPNIPILDNAYNSISALDLPISYFYHMEYGVNTEEGLKGLRQKSETLEKIRNEKDYNFMTEPQMFKAFEANMKSKITIERNKQAYGYEFIINTKFHDNKDPYNRVVGIKFEPGEQLIDSDLNTDADIYHSTNKDLYIALKDQTKIAIGKQTEEPHITRANGPIEIEKHEDTMKIQFNYEGLQQIKIYAPKGIEINNDEFQLETQGDHSILTRYGAQINLDIILH